jgi:urease accessory protein
MEPLAFVATLQITDSFYPVGAYAYSDGLETASAAGLIHDAPSLGGWLDHFLENVFVPCEGLALAKCMLALKAGDIGKIIDIDEELTAIRPAGAVRAASTAVGRRLLSIHASICTDERFSELVRALPHANAATAYAVVFKERGVAERDAVIAFGYNRLAGIISAGLRLISMGQQQGQMLLTTRNQRLPDVAERILQMTGEPLRSFGPMLDIQQMNHQYVYSRLFRS